MQRAKNKPLIYFLIISVSVHHLYYADFNVVSNATTTVSVTNIKIISLLLLLELINYVAQTNNINIVQIIYYEHQVAENSVPSVHRHVVLWLYTAGTD